MLYAKVVPGLPLEGPFDYIIPPDLEAKVKSGFRVRVNFGFKKITGYVVGVSAKTRIKKLKYIIEVIDDSPVLDEKMLLLTKEISDYYACSWGEAIECALPQAIRKGRKVAQVNPAISIPNQNVSEKFFLRDPNSGSRFIRYISEVRKVIEAGKGAIVAMPDMDSVREFKSLAEDELKAPIAVLCRNDPKETDEWLKVKTTQAKLAVGTRAVIFAPFSNLGLIVIDEENNTVYKQEQTPHYNAREAAFMRAKAENVKLILGGAVPSLECYSKIHKDEIGVEAAAGTNTEPEVKIMDMKFEFRKGDTKGLIFSRYLIDSINSSLIAKEKVLLFLNRKGFATYAFCHNCKTHIVCPRCNVSLVYYFDENILSCNHCNFKMAMPEICPKCNAGYIKFKGAGTERAESEISRLFPQAKIGSGKDIVISTSAIFKEAGVKFGLIGVLNIDNSLSRIDFRSSEKTFDLLSKLKALALKKMIIQTGSPKSPIFSALGKNDPDIFYKDELKQRKQLGLPPYKHLALIRVRSNNENKAKASAEVLFEELKSTNANKGVEVVSFNPGIPPKLRGNFYWQILLRSSGAGKISKFIKNKLKDFWHSGIIITIDIDPL